MRYGRQPSLSPSGNQHCEPWMARYPYLGNSGDSCGVPEVPKWNPASMRHGRRLTLSPLSTPREASGGNQLYEPWKARCPLGNSGCSVGVPRVEIRSPASMGSDVHGSGSFELVPMHFETQRLSLSFF